MSVNAQVYSTETDETREEAISAAQTALRAKKTIVIPTDTVYGIAADAFSPEAVAALLSAKGRSRKMPPPVLIFDEAVLPGLADDVSDDATALARKFWPGALTLILYSQPSLNWDLGDAQGTVALRVPNDPLTLNLLRQVGPLAVSSANKTGRIAATSAQEALEQLGEDVELIVDGGTRPISRGKHLDSADVLPSTIVDCTSDRLVVVREGAISLEELREVVPSIVSKAELEEQNNKSSLRSVDSAATTAPSQRGGSVAADLAQARVEDNTAEESENHDAAGAAGSRGLGEGPRAAAPAAGTFNAGLVGSSSSPAVDQMRTKEAHRQEVSKANGANKTKPVSVSEAHALVFSTADQDSAQQNLGGSVTES